MFCKLRKILRLKMVNNLVEEDCFFSWHYLSLVVTDLVLQDSRSVFCVVSSCCGFLSSLCLFVLVDFCFFCGLQGLWTAAHQCDRAPQWQLPSAAGPWPVPRCLRRWTSQSAHCFLCAVKALNTAAIQWTDSQFFGCGPRPSRPSVCVCTRASAVQGDSCAFLALCCWIALIVWLWLSASSFFQALW